MKSSTIWFISKYYASPPNEGSGSSRAYLLMREMSKMGHNTIIFTSSADPYSEIEISKKVTQYKLVDGVKVWYLRGLKYSRSISYMRVFSWLHFEYVLFRDLRFEHSKPDVVIVSSPSILTIFNGLYLKIKHRAKLIFEVRDIWPLTLVEDAGIYRYNPFIILMGVIEKVAYKYSNGIVGTMPNLKQHVKTILKEERKVGFAPMGISSEYLKDPLALESEYVEKYIPKNKFLIIYAGTIGVANALDTMFGAADLLSTDAEIHFLLVGEGALLKKFEKEYGNKQNITFAPKVKKGQVQSILKYGNLLYFSVANSEVWKFGQSLNKIVDYMMASKPIVASFSGYNSMLNEADCGVFVPAGDSRRLAVEIVRLKNLPKNELLSMGEKGKTWLFKHRNYKALATNYLEYIDDLR